MYTCILYIDTYIHTYVRTYVRTLHTYIHYITLHYITLHTYHTLHYITLHCIALHCITLHYIHTYISLSKYIYILFICDYILVYIYHTSIYRINIRTYVGLLFWHVLRTYQDVQSHPKLTCRGFLADQYRCQKGFWMSKQPPSYQDVIPFDLKYLEN